MVYENIIPKTETIYEIKSEIPSFEEFMRDYKVDSNLNYDDLGHSSLGDSKGYGPSSHTATRQVLCVMQYSFRLRIECHNWNGYGSAVEVNSVDEALWQADCLENGLWNDSWQISDSVLYKCAGLVREAARVGTNCPVDGYVVVQGKFWGGWKAKTGGF